MPFSAKIASLVMALATCSAISAHRSVVVAREAAISPYIVLYHEPGFRDDGFSPTISEGVNFNLPSEWVDDVGSVDIVGNYKCTFFTKPDAEGESTPPLEGPIPEFLPPFDNNIKSLTCSKAFV